MFCTKLNISKNLLNKHSFRYNQFSSLAQRKYSPTNRTTPKKSSTSNLPIDNFKDLGIREAICKALQQNFNITKPTPCQQQLIPLILSGNDVLIRDLTGSGKTFGIVLALLNKTRIAPTSLSQNSHSITTSLLVVPSKELAFQIESWIHLLLRDTNLPMKSIIQVAVRTFREIEQEQLENLKKSSPHILVGTAKRLLELVENYGLKFHRLNTLALDEADHLIKLPSKHAILKKIINREIHPKPTELLTRHILSESSRKPQVIVSSATLNRALRYYFKDNQLVPDPILVDMSQGCYSPPTISHHCLTVTSNNIRNLVTSISAEGKEDERIQDFEEDDDRMIDSVVGAIELEQHTLQTGIIFVNHKINVPKLVKRFREYGIPAKELSSSYIPINEQGYSYNSLSTIEIDLDDFTAKPTFAPKTTIYVAHEFTSRGIDIPNISHVFILGLPSSAAEYLHMSGRTGRMGRDGKVISFIKDGQKRVMTNYITLLSLKLDNYEHVN